MTRCPSNLVPMRPQDVFYLCERMRADEQEQMRAFFDLDAEQTPLFFLNKTGPRYTLIGDDGMPLACGGWEPVSDGVMQSWMIGCDEAWTTHWRSLTKASRWLMDALLSHGIRRLQTNALASRTGACEWYERGLGMKPEGIWRQYGRQGQDVAAFSRVAGD